MEEPFGGVLRNDREARHLPVPALLMMTELAAFDNMPLGIG